jgi:two-component system chemotaxis response regulator CheB
LVLIGTSTGGPAALDIVLPQLPLDLPWPVLVAQHMPASFTGPFARRLDRQCDLKVVEVSRLMPLQSGTIYIGRGDADVIVASRATGMVAMPIPAQLDYPWHPSVERMVTSALEHYGTALLVGVLMTGMGRDGADAMTLLRNQGGRTIAEANPRRLSGACLGNSCATAGLNRPAGRGHRRRIVDLVSEHALVKRDSPTSAIVPQQSDESSAAAIADLGIPMPNSDGEPPARWALVERRCPRWRQRSALNRLLACEKRS